MGRHLVEDVRDIALVGHRGAAKSRLADALLFEAHAVDRLGRVDDGTSVTPLTRTTDRRSDGSCRARATVSHLLRFAAGLCRGHISL